MVERDLPKVDVAGSSPVIRSKACFSRPFIVSVQGNEETI